ncbi:MAG: TetR/AcrR family transcriptional regulator [Chloroflexi bacterium]|nr:TetR/AcrR family transcriptional regulator [Chloroflexota bacterium]
MSNRPEPRRRYESPRRREQAAATRGAILDAARRVFVERGYVQTTIRSVAAAAGVSPETVFATFGDKRTLLASVMDVAIAGDDALEPILDRDWVRALREEPDRGQRVSTLARRGRGILERRSTLDEVVRQAAAMDPSLADLESRGKAERLAGQRRLLAIVAGPDGFRPGLDLDVAADILFALGSPDVWRLLVVDRGWSPARFEAWYAQAIASLLA